MGLTGPSPATPKQTAGFLTSRPEVLSQNRQDLGWELSLQTDTLPHLLVSRGFLFNPNLMLLQKEHCAETPTQEAWGPDMGLLRSGHTLTFLPGPQLLGSLRA